jgi:hypothetical protein
VATKGDGASPTLFSIRFAAGEANREEKISIWQCARGHAAFKDSPASGEDIDLTR